jgi:hypothetical protein
MGEQDISKLKYKTSIMRGRWALNKIIYDIEKDHMLKCVEMYVKVNNAEPWNDKWTLETAYKRLNDIYCSKF